MEDEVEVEAVAEVCVELGGLVECDLVFEVDVEVEVEVEVEVGGLTE